MMVMLTVIALSWSFTAVDLLKSSETYFTLAV